MKSNRTLLSTLLIAAVALVGGLSLTLTGAVDSAIAGEAPAWAAGQKAMGPDLLPDKATPGAVAVVELFTSEGCSSCPSADTVLDAIGEEAAARGISVFPLALHVDYWDDLGWPDPFASHDFTRRQRAFNGHRGSRRIYTPQMVVNGQQEFVGSDRRSARAALAKALSQPATVQVKVSEVKALGDRALTVRYALEGAIEGAHVQAAVVQGGIVSRVQRGENAGRTLHHGNTVRAMSHQKAQASGEIALTLPEGLSPESARVVVFVQAGGSWKVLGAAAAGLPAS